MKKAVVLVWNDFTNDKRVMNISSFLASSMKTTVLAAKTIKELPTFEDRKYNLIRIPLFSALMKSTKDPASLVGEDKEKEKSISSLYINKLKNNRLKITIVEIINGIIYNSKILLYNLKFRPNLIYCNDLDTLTVGFVSGKIIGAKVIYDSHEVFLDGSRYHNAFLLRKIWWRFIERNLVHKVDGIIVTTEYRKKIIEQKYSIKNINVIRNCHNKQEYKKYDLFRKEYGILPATPILLYQGGLTEVRGIFTIVDIVEQINDIAMIFMGMGKDKQKLKNYIYQKKMDKRIFVKDAVSPAQLIAYTSSADIGLQLLQNINSNHYSTISNKIFEYMTAGLAIIASDFPEIRKIIVNYNLGLVVDPASNEEIREAIYKIISNKTIMDEMKNNSINAALENTWEIEEKKLKNIVDNITNPLL